MSVSWKAEKGCGRGNSPCGPRRAAGGSAGFTFVALLFAIMIMGISLAVTGKVWSTMAHREKEAELLFRGNEIRVAIGRYYEESPGAKSYPKTLEVLMKDTRWPVPRRYLRRPYADPFTGKADWELIKAPDGGVIGVRSRSDKKPYKRKGFPAELVGFEGSASYGGWDFIYVPLKQADR